MHDQLHLKEIFFLGLGLTVTEINVQKQDLKNIKNVKDVGMACQKVCKQNRDDIIVKVNLQSPIPTSFYITVANWCEKYCRNEAL